MTDIDIQFGGLRREMVEQIARHASDCGDETGRLALDSKVLQVMEAVPRHEFVPAELRAYAYFDTPLPIGFDKTISQPFIVALMTDLLEPQAGDRVLDVGTGLGYQAAVLASLVDSVYTVEVIEELAHGAERRLTEQGFANIHFKVGDGTYGWHENGPYDKILVAAAPELIPISLLNQLRPGGRMIVPAGIENAQQLLLVTRNMNGRLSTEEILAVRFSPLVTSTS